MFRRLATAIPAIGLILLAGAGPAAACGFLVAENGTVQLVRTTTLAAYFEGVEHYVTSFEYAAGVDEFGSIVPLPDVPTSVERGGDWTLQRLNREFAPPQIFAAAGAAEDEAEVILETQIDALDIAVLRGGAVEVVEWANDHGYDLPDDAADMLAFYANRSPIFMAARFDSHRAEALGQNAGDSTPIHVTIPTDAPWVPLSILGMGKQGDARAEADLYLLTDDEPILMHGTGRGVRVDASEEASSALLDDLRSDTGMGWVPDEAWVTKVAIDEASSNLDYDLAISVDGTRPSRLDTGLPVTEAAVVTQGGHLAGFDIGTSAAGTGLPLRNADHGESPWLLLPLLAFAIAGIATLVAGPIVMLTRRS
jgi:Uncharacterized protein conserved in bacteria (DUF2330)